jgi:K+-sensing histidine kinase KdpD
LAELTEVSVSRSGIIVDIAPAAVQSFWPSSEAERLPLAVQYLLALAAVVLAVAVGLSLRVVIPASGLTLLFVLPVVATAVTFGWRVSMVTAIAGALAFDFFFAPPLYSLAIASPADIWSTALLLVIGAVVSTLAARSRRQAEEAKRAAGRAQALQGLAHAVMTGASCEAVLAHAAHTLNVLFDAPAAILARTPEGMKVRASAGDATPSSADRAAAASALDLNAPTHGGVYPTDRARFDFWPVTLQGGEALALGVDFAHAENGRAADVQGQVEAVCGYLASLREDRAN